MPTTPGERGKRPMAYSARILDSCHSCSTVNYFRHRFPAASINFLRVPNYCLFVHLCLDGGDRQIWTRWGREFGHLSPWRSESPSAVSLSRWSRLCRSTNIELIDLCPEIRSDAQVQTHGVEGPSFGHLGLLTPHTNLEANSNIRSEAKSEVLYIFWGVRLRVDNQSCFKHHTHPPPKG